MSDTPKNYPKVFAAILNWNGMVIDYNGTPILESCLKSLAKVDYPNIKFALIDADSKDESVEFAQKNFPEIQIIKVKDKGSAALQNEGISFAFKKCPEAEFILLITNDMIFAETKWLKKMVNAAEKEKSIGIVNCKLNYPNGKVQHGGTILSILGVNMIHDAMLSNKSRYQHISCSSLALIKKQALLYLGGFDEIFSPFSWEDIDISSRFLRNGYKLYYVGNTKIFHLESYSTLNRKIKKKWTPEEIEFCMRRNAYIYYLRYAKYLLPFYIFVDTASNIISFRNDKIAIRKNIGYRLRTQIPALISALSLYKKNRIKKFT